MLLGWLHLPLPGKGPASVPASGADALQYRDRAVRLHVLRPSEFLAHLHTMSRASRRQHA